MRNKRLKDYHNYPKIRGSHLIRPIVTERTLDAPDLVAVRKAKLLSFLADGTLIVALGFSVYMWKCEMSSLFIESSSQIDAVLSTSRGLIISAAGIVELWDTKSRTFVRKIIETPFLVSAIAEFKDRLAIGDTSGCAYVEMNNKMLSNKENKSEVIDVAWNLSGTLLAIAWPTKLEITGRRGKYSYSIGKTIRKMAWISNTRLVIAYDNKEGLLEYFEIEENKSFTITTGDAISTLIWSPKWGLFVMHSTEPYTWEIRNKNGYKIASYTGHRGPILDAALHKDILATVSLDETVRIWYLSQSKNHTTEPSVSCQPMLR